jgi:hypothetical protein
LNAGIDGIQTDGLIQVDEFLGGELTVNRWNGHQTDG